MTLVVLVLAYALALWLGFYLLGRDPADARLRRTGLGLIAYALALALESFIQIAPEATWAPAVVAWQRAVFVLPGLFWAAVLLSGVREGEEREQSSLARRLAPLLELAAPLVLLAARYLPEAGYGALATAVLLALAAGLVSVIFGGRAAGGARGRRGWTLLVLATLFFALGAGLHLLALEQLSAIWTLLAIGGDLIVLGFVIARADALDAGEALWPDATRSFFYSEATVLVFGGQVALVGLWVGVTAPWLALLLATIAAGVVWQTHSGAWQSIGDRLLFRRRPAVRARREASRAAASAATRLDDALDPNSLPAEEFTRLTRRALSQMGNLPRLAASPLTRLALIERRLLEREAPLDTLARAAELKRLLAESIARLKPPGEAEFGDDDGWRHYNALYFPYVVGLKPFSRRANGRSLDGAAREAWEWFRAQVPPRTLYNWQTAAARLVAQDLRERSAARAAGEESAG